LDVNSDCTGTLYVKAYESGKLVHRSVVSRRSTMTPPNAVGVQQSLTLPDGTNVPVVLTVECRKQH